MATILFRRAERFVAKIRQQHRGTKEGDAAANCDALSSTQTLRGGESTVNPFWNSRGRTGIAGFAESDMVSTDFQNLFQPTKYK